MDAALHPLRLTQHLVTGRLLCDGETAASTGLAEGQQHEGSEQVRISLFAALTAAD